MWSYHFPFMQRNSKSSYRPLLPLILSNPHDKSQMPVRQIGIIDTGADYSIVPGFVAESLNHDNENHQVKTDGYRGVSSQGTSYLHTFAMKIILAKKSPGGIDIMQDGPFIEIPKIKFRVVPKARRMLLGMDFISTYCINFDFLNDHFSLSYNGQETLVTR